MKKNKIGIFGGTFNPPHIGHINIAISSYEKFGLTKIIFVPTKKPTYKYIPKNFATCKQRLEMLYLIKKYLFFSEICNIEIKNMQPNYTFNTIHKLKKNVKDTKFYFILGSDMFFSIFQWYRAFELFKLITFIVYPRNKLDLLLLKKNKYKYSKIKFSILENVKFINISSTSLRMFIKKKFLHKEVYEYIIKNNLYLSK